MATTAADAASEGLSFIVVGASVAGLASAIALSDAGHRVRVLEAAAALGGGAAVPGCARVPPNAYKILAGWGLEDALRQVAVENAGFGVYKYASDLPGGARDLMGLNTWDPELLEDARGTFMFTTHAALLRLLYARAQSPRVEIRFGAAVAAVDGAADAPSVTLSSGEVIRGDAVIGADGARGVVRRMLLDAEEVPRGEEEEDLGMTIYCSVVPHALAKEHRELDSFYEFPESTVSMGSGVGAVTDMDENRDLFFFLYTPSPALAHSGTWTAPAPASMAEVIADAPSDGPLKLLASLAGPTIALPYTTPYDLESWVSESGRVLALGEAAHPLPACALHTYSLALEDALFLGRVFGHTAAPGRVPELLYAFEEHRRARCASIRGIDAAYIGMITTPDGPAQAGRDAMMRANAAAGRNVFQAEGDMQEMLDETRMVFSYDAADDADEWWVSWGRYRERAASMSMPQEEE
ncbi:FAD-binding-3 domain-containing protein [Mycena indigotica]|uniref:FAD-binding-3 domain-containing protein n=1 Tax=Mycena indigotica TaxID=2126181 RepID=A0A8H6T3E4_9AGAR|nr:FAD-binding-3 domain-containing protein [Mycena indigotica]KAF7310326.1 FAD-binding-3 domain-containing protein [Mycena indigotica]